MTTAITSAQGGPLFDALEDSAPIPSKPWFVVGAVAVFVVGIGPPSELSARVSV